MKTSFVTILFFLITLAYGADVSINWDETSWYKGRMCDSNAVKTLFDRDSIYDLSEGGVYTISATVELEKWNDTVPPYLFLGPSPFPVVIRLNGAEKYRWGNLEKSSTLANFSPENIALTGIEYGDNRLCIEYYSDGQTVKFPHFFVGTYDKVVRATAKQKLFNLWLIQAISVMAFFAFLIFLGYSVSSGFKDRDLLYFSLFAFSVFIGYSPFFMNIPMGNEVAVFKLSRIGLTMLIFFLHLFCTEFTGRIKNRYWRLTLTTVLVITSLFILHANNKSEINAIFAILSVTYIYPLLFISLAALLIEYVVNRKGITLIVLVVYVGIVAAGMYDLALILSLREPYCWMTPYGYFLLIFSIVIAVTMRHRFLFRDLVRYKAELVYTNQSLMEAHAKVVSESQVKEQFIKAIAHEFRTPLNGMTGTVTSLAKDATLSRESAQKVSLLSSSFLRFELIVQNLLDYQALRSGEIETHNSRFKPVESLNRIIDLCRDDAKMKGISLISLVRPDTLPEYLIGDVNRVGLIVNNLINNAIKFTENGGISIKAVYENSALYLDIADTGCGIQAESQELIFSAFERGEEYTFTQRYEGIGLGLAIVDAIVKKMNGHISLNSELGKGTTFTVELPLEEVQVSQLQKKEYNILVTDDNIVNRKVAVIQLEKEGIKTWVASNGQEALDMVLNHSFDLVFMDVQMPVMDGIEATRHIKKINPDLPIIGMTANASKEECLEAGMSDVVFKPTSVEIMDNILNSYL